MMTDRDDAAAVRALLVPLVQYALSEDAATAQTVGARAIAAQQALRARFGGSFPADLDLDSQWVRAVEEAERDSGIAENAGVSLTLPQMLPFPASMLLDDPFLPDALRLRIRGAAATG